MKKKKLIKQISLTALALNLISLPTYADSIDDTFNFNNIEMAGYNSISGADDSTAIAINPGGIGFKSSAGELFFSNSIGSNQQTNLFGSFSGFNAGFQNFKPRGNNLPTLRKYFTGVGYAPVRGINAGISYVNIQSPENDQINASSIDLGLLLRPNQNLSIGIVARNILNPKIADFNIGRSYVGSLGFRPGTDRLTFTIDGEWVEGSPVERMRGIFGIESEFLDGLLLKGKIGSDAQFKQINFGFDLGFNFSHFGIGYFQFMGPDQNQDKLFASNSRNAGYIKLSVARNRNIFERRNSRFAELNLDGNISANKKLNIFDNEKLTSVYDYIETIDKASNDKDIAGLVLKINSFNSGLAVCEEIREKLASFKKSGKKVIAYINSASMPAYYLATVADHIVMHPIGDINLKGVASTRPFYKGLLDKIGIQAQFVNVGKYKSGGSSYTRYKSTDADNEQLKDMISDFYDHLTSYISKNRKLTKGQLQNIIDNKTIVTSDEAKDLKLINEVAHYDELDKIAGKVLENKFEYPISKIQNRIYQDYSWDKGYRVAIINAQGTIVEGKSNNDIFSNENIMGSQTISEMIRYAREDDSIKAIVFRVDSGGGSALASDIIARELELVQEAKKPIIISMGNVAASGGYWISAKADKIIANSNTITGSIGVLTGKINFSGLYKKLGINNEVIKKGENADVYSESRPFTEKEINIIAKSGKAVYRKFLERVSKGRNIKISDVNELAQGHVYSGKRAKELKLIDEIGGLQKAIDIAKSMIKNNDKKPIKILNMENGLGLLSSLPDSFNSTFQPKVLYDLIQKNNILLIMPDIDI